VLTLINASDLPAKVMVTARPCAWADPSVTWPTAQVLVDAKSSTVQTLTQLFPASALVGFNLTEALVTVDSNQPVVVNVLGLSLNGDNSTAATAANNFALVAPRPAAQQ
jgi:hypothetical protein